MIVVPISALDTCYEQGSVATTDQKVRDSQAPRIVSVSVQCRHAKYISNRREHRAPKANLRWYNVGGGVNHTALTGDLS